MNQTYAAPAQKDAGNLTVSHPHDPAERQADQAADIVARGGSVAGWSFASVPASGPSVHRDEASPKQPTEADKYKAGAKKVGEALLETKAGKELIKKVEDTEPVKAIKKGLDTTAGKVIAGGVIAAGAGGLAAAKQPLPLPLPEIKIAPGVSVGVHVEGPLNNPTSGGITLTFKEQGGSGKKGPTESDKIADETRRLRASNEMFKSAQQKAQEQADERAVVAAMFARSAGSKPVIPLAPGAKPYIIETPTQDTSAADEPKKDAAQPVQRDAVSAAPGSLDTSGVEGVGRAGGRPLDAGIRRSMETRFGYDFSAVRIHDDAQGHAAADGVQAHAFTVGNHIGLAAGRSSPSTPEGRRLLAHELAHVVQQRNPVAGPRVIHRFSSFSAEQQASGESLGWQHPGHIDMRVSNDGQMAVDDLGWNEGTNKHAWTTPELIAQSNSVLNAQGSRANLRAVPGGRSVSGAAPVSGAAANLVQVEPFKPAGGDPFDLASDCGNAARQIMGSGPAGRDVAVIQRPAAAADSGTGGAIAGGILGGLGGAGLGMALGSLAGPLGMLIGGIVGGIAGIVAGAYAGRGLAKHPAQPAREEYLTPRTYHAATPPAVPTTTPEEWSEEAFKSEFGEGLSREEAYARYAGLTDAKRDDFDRRHGMNRYATPRVGQGLTIGTEGQMPGFSRYPGVRTWNFHYAATVLTSGPDYVTLESAARWAPTNWIFYMYGTAKDQSFHEQQGATETHGTKYTTFVVQPESTLKVKTVRPTTLRSESSAIRLDVGTDLRVLDRRPSASGAVEVTVRVTSGNHAGAEGRVPEADIR